MTFTYISTYPVTLPNSHRVSRTDKKVNFVRRYTNTHKAEFQCIAYIVSRYYCELINQPRKHSKYPVPVFVLQQTTGLRITNRTCLRLCIYESFIPLLFPCCCVCVHASACVHVPMHAQICACFCVNTNKDG